MSRSVYVMRAVWIVALATAACSERPADSAAPNAPPPAAPPRRDPAPAAPAPAAPAVPAPQAPAADPQAAPATEPQAPAAQPALAPTASAERAAAVRAAEPEPAKAAAGDQRAAEQPAPATKPAAMHDDGAQPAAVTPCGDEGQPMCPLQAWMERNLQKPLDDGDLAAVAQGLGRVPELVPDPRWNAAADGWSAIADAASAAA